MNRNLGRAGTTLGRTTLLLSLQACAPDLLGPDPQDAVAWAPVPTRSGESDAGWIEDERELVAAIAAYAAAIEARDSDAFAATIPDEYEYFPRGGDAEELPWLVGDSWGRTVEVAMFANMSDTTFVSVEIGTGLRSLTVEYRVESVNEVPGGLAAVCSWSVVGERVDMGEALEVTTALVFESSLGEGRQVRRVRELTRPETVLSWGFMKSYFR